MFDSHHPPSPALIDQCVHCGFCLPACPTYVLWGQEMDSPRGRIYLMRLASEGKTEMTGEWVKHFDTCLGCMACMTACPSGVDYAKLIEATRGQIERNYTRSLGERLVRRLVFATFPRPGCLRWLRWPLLAYQKSGAGRLLRRSGLLGRLPASLRAMESLMPPLTAREATPALTPAVGTARQRVGLLLGCVQREFLSRVNAASARVLAAEGYDVVAPPDQPCCGALLMHAGEDAQAVALARRMIDVFEEQRVDLVAINAGGCGSHMKEYGHLLRDDPAYAERAARFSARCRDISELLTATAPRAPRHELPMTVAYHDSCHLQHAQRVRTAPRTLLAQIPGLDLVELPDGPICCGSAGIYNIVQPQTATELGDRKAGLIAPLDVDVVATGNPGCILQLQSALARAGSRTRVVHTVELLDASLTGELRGQGQGKG
jgi:glycolate oxidase iron-sulfur subunit